MPTLLRSFVASCYETRSAGDVTILYYEGQLEKKTQLFLIAILYYSLLFTKPRKLVKAQNNYGG